MFSSPPFCSVTVEEFHLTTDPVLVASLGTVLKLGGGVFTAILVVILKQK